MQALYEELAKQLAVVVKESEAVVCGVEYKVQRDHYLQASNLLSKKLAEKE